MRKQLLILSIAVFFAACNTQVIDSQIEAIPDGWNKNQPSVFTIINDDTLSSRDIFLLVRNSNEYQFNNLFLIVSMDYPNGKVVTDTVEYRMAKPDGTWLGQGMGSIKESKLWYKEGITLKEKGDYTLTIGHAVRNNGEVNGVTTLQGITDIGYSIENISKNN